MSYQQTDILQRPRPDSDGNCYTPVHQPLIFTVENQDIVANEIKVKYVAKVFYSNSDTPQTGVATDLIGTFKTTPNNEGSGIFDMSPVFSSFLNSDNMARFPAQFYYDVNAIDFPSHRIPIHVMDRFSRARNSVAFFRIQFRTEWLDETTNQIISTNTAINTDTITVFNGYVKHDENITVGAYGSGTTTPYLGIGGPLNQNLGYPIGQFKLNGSDKRLLTNAPTTQYVNKVDYGTMAMLNIADIFGNDPDGPYKIKFKGYKYDGSSLTDYNLVIDADNGAFSPVDQNKAFNKITFFACGPANLIKVWPAFLTNLNQLDFYNLRVEANDGTNLSQTYTYYINCPNGTPSTKYPQNIRGYEPIRLAWLNQYGAWDYYTFRLKSTRTIKTKGTTYRPLSGQWNQRTYSMSAYKGGKKTLKVNATEVIKMNTDYINEQNSTWLEELVTSPEIYIVNPLDDSIGSLDLDAGFNNSVIPVRLTTNSHRVKTVANDKLIQYTFDIEKTKTLRTQSV